MAVGFPRTRRRSEDSVHRSWMPWMLYIGPWNSIHTFLRCVRHFSPNTAELWSIYWHHRLLDFLSIFSGFLPVFFHFTPSLMRNVTVLIFVISLSDAIRFCNSKIGANFYMVHYACIQWDVTGSVCVYAFVTNFLHHVAANNWQKWMTSDNVNSKIIRVTFFLLRHSVVPAFNLSFLCATLNWLFAVCQKLLSYHS